MPAITLDISFHHVVACRGVGCLLALTMPDLACQVYLYGAVVTSWTQPSGDEVLYVRPDAKFDKSKPISGGIPHCFPQVVYRTPALPLLCGPHTSYCYPGMTAAVAECLARAT